MKKMIANLTIDVPDYFTAEMVEGIISVFLTTPEMYVNFVNVEEYIQYEFTKQ